MSDDYSYYGEGDIGGGNDWLGALSNPISDNDYYEPSVQPNAANIFLAPLEEREASFKQWLQTPEAQQYSAEQLKSLEDMVIGGVSPDQMEQFVKQAEADVAPGGIMSGNPFGTQTGGTRGQSLLDKLLGNKNLLTAGLGGLGALASYKSAQQARKEAAGASAGKNAPVTATRTAYKGTKYSAAGGRIRFKDGGVTNPIDYTPSFSDVSGVGLGAGFADPKTQEVIDKLNLRAAGGKSPELDTLANQLAQQEDAIKNRFLSDNVSIDQITGDIDPIQTLRNVRAYDPSTFDATVNSLSDVPGQMNVESLGNLKASIKDLQNLGLPYDDLMDVVQSIAEIRNNPELVGNLSNLAGDIRSVTKPTDEEELGSNYSSLMALLTPKMGEDVTQTRAAGGGIGSLEMARGGRALPPRYLNGHSDGMADKVPAHIDNKRPAALSDGEFVIPADVVSHLGNGNSNAGAKRLYEMMDRIRAARTGNHKQGKQINPDKFMPR